MLYKVQSWEDYWELYNQLINFLTASKEELVVAELKEAQKYVNGFTDGWHDFKNEFERVILSYRSKLTAEQLRLAEYLLMTLRQSLANR